MNRTKAQEILTAYGNPMAKIGDTNLIFARQTSKEVDEIEAMEDEALISHWKSLVYMNEIYGQVSLNELQRISLIELEMDCRCTIDTEPLKDWYKTAEENFDERDFLN